MPDALTKKALNRLGVFTTFLATAASNPGYIGGAITEVGIPHARSDTSPPAAYIADVPLWQRLLHEWLRAADDAGLWVFGWASGPGWGNYNLGINTNANTYTPSGTNINRPMSPGAIDVLEGHPTQNSTTYRRGDNNAGLDFGHKEPTFTNANSGGVADSTTLQYYVPTAGDVAAMASRRTKNMRLPINWERLQPTLLGALNSTYLGYVTTIADACLANGIGLILELHNYARYEYNDAGTKKVLVLRTTNGINLSDPGPTFDAVHPENSDAGAIGTDYLIDVWRRLSNVFRTHAGVVAYELMNEPHDVKATTGSFSGTTLNDWNAGTVAGWIGGAGVVLSHTVTTPYEGSGSLRLSFTTGTAGVFFNARAERGSISGTGNTVRGRVRLNGTPTGTWQGRWEWQDAAFGPHQGAVVTLTPGVWTEVACDFVADAIAGSAINLIFQVQCNSPAGTQAVTCDVDLLERGSFSGAYTAVTAWEYITQQVLTDLRLRPDDVSKRDTKTVLVPGMGWNVLAWPHSTAWIVEPVTNPGTHGYVTHHYFDSETGGAGEGEGVYQTSTKRYADAKTYALSQGFSDDADTLAPTISILSPGTPTSTGTIITWTTSEAADSRVEYGVTNSLVPLVYGTSTLRNASLVIPHSVVLSGLIPNTTYVYRVSSRDSAGNLITSSGSFTTAAASSGGGGGGGTTDPAPGGGGGAAPACFSAQERLFYIRADGIRYPLHARPWRTVLSQEGFGTPPLEYVTDRAPFQHGDTIRSFYLGPRPVQVVVLHNFKSRADYRNGRDLFLQTVQPETPIGNNAYRMGKLLYYLANGQKRQLDVTLDSGPGFVQPEGGWREWSFTEAIRFTAHDPLWYDPNAVTTTFTFTAAENQLVFPVTFPIIFSGTSSHTDITYGGTWIEYPIITVYGPVTGFNIENLTTGDGITITGDIPAVYSVTIDLHGLKTVVGSDGTNWLHRISSDSELSTFSLAPHPTAPGGVNQIRVSGSGTNLDSFVSLSWYKRYFGI